MGKADHPRIQTTVHWYIDNVHQLGVSLEKIPSRGSCLPNILLTGDFNVPDID